MLYKTQPNPIAVFVQCSNLVAISKYQFRLVLAHSSTVIPNVE